MGTLKLQYARKRAVDGVVDKLSISDFSKFNSSLLDLGDISKDGKYFEALAAIFDLEAFTSFCNQIDPHLVVPEYMNEFLSWLFESVSSEFVYSKDAKEVLLWCPLPFYAKFLGDGVLFLWDTKNFDLGDVGNVVVSLFNICLDYKESFLPQIKQKVSKPPLKLRCGIARGQIISIGEEKDFIGPCINAAARLQKLGQFSFAFSRRGFNLERNFNERWKDSFVLIKSSIRGVGDEELLYVHRDEFRVLPAKVRKQFLA